MEGNWGGGDLVRGRREKEIVCNSGRKRSKGSIDEWKKEGTYGIVASVWQDQLYFYCQLVYFAKAVGRSVCLMSKRKREETRGNVG